eukprot:3447370-Amphidinium_carterae.1
MTSSRAPRTRVSCPAWQLVTCSTAHATRVSSTSSPLVVRPRKPPRLTFFFVKKVSSMPELDLTLRCQKRITTEWEVKRN